MTGTVTIKRLGHQGNGIADGPAGDIYLPHTLPGEVVEILGEGTRIVTPSPDRVKPPCMHFKSCGGCALQHASDSFVAGWKVDVVRTALKAQGLSADFKPVKTSPSKSRRRATFTGKRTKKGAMVGFHARASSQLVPVPDCKILHADIVASFPMLERLTRIAASRSAEISLAVTLSLNGLDVDVSGAKPANGPLLAELGAFCEAEKLARLGWNGEIVATRQAPAQKFGRATVVPPPGAFLQATVQGETDLVDAIIQAVGPARRIADLFAGCGTFALSLAHQAEILAVESDAASLRALDAGWRLAPNLKTVETSVRDLFRRPLLPAELAKFDAVVIDPPRAGAKAQIEELAASKVARIASVSCNPVTFARDAAVLVKGGYRLEWVQVIDQFRWSPHIELVAAFTRS